MTCPSSAVRVSMGWITWGCEPITRSAPFSTAARTALRQRDLAAFVLGEGALHGKHRRDVAVRWHVAGTKRAHYLPLSAMSRSISVTSPFSVGAL